MNGGAVVSTETLHYLSEDIFNVQHGDTITGVNNENDEGVYYEKNEGWVCEDGLDYAAIPQSIRGTEICKIEGDTQDLWFKGKILIIPEGITSIGDKAFGSLKDAIICLPQSLNSIGRSSFNYCSGLSIVLPWRV